MPLAALFPLILRTLGTTAVGWAVSDWFNERKRAQQESEENPKISKIISTNWLKWLVTGLFVAVVAAVFVFIFKEKRK